MPWCAIVMTACVGQINNGWCAFSSSLEHATPLSRCDAVLPLTQVDVLHRRPAFHAAAATLTAALTSVAAPSATVATAGAAAVATATATGGAAAAAVDTAADAAAAVTSRLSAPASRRLRAGSPALGRLHTSRRGAGGDAPSLLRPERPKPVRAAEPSLRRSLDLRAAGAWRR